MNMIIIIVWILFSRMIVIREDKTKMTLGEKVKYIKKSLREMSKDEFKEMLERNGYNRIKDVDETLFYKAFKR